MLLLESVKQAPQDQCLLLDRTFLELRSHPFVRSLAGIPPWTWFGSMSVVMTDPTSARLRAPTLTGETMQCPTNHTSGSTCMYFRE
jgi:hypothetical protein